MSHVTDDLELYALGALPAEARDRVARHVADCATCRAAADGAVETVALLPDGVPVREPPPRLRARILEAARAEAAPRGLASRLPWPWRRLGFATIALAAVALLAVDVSQGLTLRALQAEQSEYARVVADVAHGGRSWYMSGVGAWSGSGGDLVQPANGDRAFAVFHSLRDLPAGQTYALWLISPSGRWTRGANFRPDGSEIQTVRLGVDANAYDWCAVTVETALEGRHSGPVVMASTPSP